MLSLAQTNMDARRGSATTADFVAALAAHDSRAWQELFEGYYRKMYSFAYARTGDQTASEDIAAEVFVAAARGIRSYRPGPAPFAAWLYRIARNLTADHLERRRRRPSVPLEDFEVASGEWAQGVDDAADIAGALTALTAEQQEVIILRFYNDCSVQETAEAMGKSQGAVKVLQHRALAALRRRLMGGRSK